MLYLIIHVVSLLLLPFVLLGTINRSKAFFNGRKGVKIFQSYFDLRKLISKFPVINSSTSLIFSFAPYIVLVSTWLAASILPFYPGYSPLAFSGDFIVFAALLALGRCALVLAAMDTGSAFEGMGASRESYISTFAEPMFFIGIGSLLAFSSEHSFQALSHSLLNVHQLTLAKISISIFLWLILHFECSRIPVDDPQTHLELTMLHEVMILDHSGPDLAAILWSQAMKLFFYIALIASMWNPYDLLDQTALSICSSWLLMLLIAVCIGFLESLIPRIKISSLSQYSRLGFAASLVTLIILTFKG